jgi:hypothetical protein
VLLDAPGDSARRIRKILLERIFADATILSPPLGRPGSDSAVLPFYKNPDGSRTDNNIEASHAPPPPTGAELAQGGQLYLKKLIFSRANFFF